MKVADVLAFKGNLVITVKPTDTIGLLSKLLSDKRVGAAIVTSDGRTIDGVISERDIAYGLAVHKAELFTLPVSSLMTKAVITCTSDDTLAHVASTMQSRRIRHLPVEDDRRIVGMVSIRDVLNQRVGELQQQTAMLRNLVTQTARVPEDRD